LMPEIAAGAKRDREDDPRCDFRTTALVALLWFLLRGFLVSAAIRIQFCQEVEFLPVKVRIVRLLFSSQLSGSFLVAFLVELTDQSHTRGELVRGDFSCLGNDDLFIFPIDLGYCFQLIVRQE